MKSLFKRYLDSEATDATIPFAEGLELRLKRLVQSYAALDLTVPPIS